MTGAEREDGPAGRRNIGMKVPGDGCEARRQYGQNVM